MTKEVIPSLLYLFWHSILAIILMCIIYSRIIILKLAFIDGLLFFFQ